jgi:biotin carboxylase
LVTPINPEPDSGFILLIAPARSYRVASYINAAGQLGHRLLIVSDSKHSLVSSIASGITVDFTRLAESLDIILDAIHGKRILAVLATDDLVVTLSSRVAQALGLPHNDIEATRLTYRKDLARERLKQQACNVPEFRVCNFADVTRSAAEITYPVVLKPLMLSGSRGVIRADDAEQFIAAAQQIEAIVARDPGDDYEKSHFLVEAFLPGAEIAIDGFVQNGKLLMLALFDKPEPLNGPCFEESFYITPSRLPELTQQAIITQVEKCCQAYGLTHGPIHAEARITDAGVFLIEMASRTIGGQCAQLIEYVLGRKLEEVIIQLMSFEKIEWSRSADYAGVLMIPIPRRGMLKRVEGLLQAQQVEYITNVEIHIQPGYELIPLPEGSSYLGFIFARAPSFDNAWQALQQAHARLHFVTAPSWTLEPG